MRTRNNRFILESGVESNINERYKIVPQKLCELNTLQFAVTVHLFPPLKFSMLLKERHELCNDNAACTIFDERIKKEFLRVIEKLSNGDLENTDERDKSYCG